MVPPSASSRLSPCSELCPYPTLIFFVFCFPAAEGSKHSLSLPRFRSNCFITFHSKQRQPPPPPVLAPQLHPHTMSSPYRSSPTINLKYEFFLLVLCVDVPAPGTVSAFFLSPTPLPLFFVFVFCVTGGWRRTAGRWMVYRTPATAITVFLL